MMKYILLGLILWHQTSLAQNNPDTTITLLPARSEEGIKAGTEFKIKKNSKGILETEETQISSFDKIKLKKSLFCRAY